jgi:hypothetical protein
MPYEGVPSEVCPRPATVTAMAFRGEEAFRNVYPELCGDFEPYSPSCQGRPGGRGYPPDDAVDRREDGPGIQSEEESERGLLGRSFSCNRCGGGSPFDSPVESMN